MNRRNFIKSTALASGSLWFAWGARRAPAAQQPIRIGFLAPLTGVAAAAGRELVDGWSLFWKQHGLQVAGRPIEVVVEDDGSNPDIALQKARRLVGQEHVDMLVGDILANTGLAVAEYVKGNGVPYFMPVVAADDLTQRSRIPNVLRVAGFSASQMTRPLGDWCRKQGYKKVVSIAQDYTFGYEQCGGFIQTFSDEGGEVTGQLWHPIGTSDFSPYLGQIQSFDPDVVFAVETGADAARLLKQWTNFGMKDRIPILTTQNTTDQSIIRTLRPDQCLGIVSSAHFAEGRDDPLTRAFVDAYEEAYGKLPAIFAAESYSAGVWIAQAMEAVDGEVEDRKRFLGAMREVEVDCPLGKDIHMDAYGNPIYNIYIRKVVQRDDGKLVNGVIETYQDVSQFWKYDPEQYMKQPPYSREFQGIKKS